MRILLALLLLLLPSVALALEYHGENTIYQDTVWQGEVLVDGILTVAADVTLEIRPGTRVRFSRIDTNDDGIGESEIFVQGKFIARGSAKRPVIFTSAAKNPQPGDWGALNVMMNESGGNLLEHCLVEYGYRGFHAHFSAAHLRFSTFRYNQRAAQFQDSTITIENCTFINNFNGLQFRDSKVILRNSRILANHWGLRAVYANLQMNGTRIAGNLTNGVNLRDSTLKLRANQVVDNRRGIYLQRCTGELIDNRIVKNREHGIYLEDSIVDVLRNQIRGNGRSGLKILNSGGRVAKNIIMKNREYSFTNVGTDDFRVGANWYGAAGRQPNLSADQTANGQGQLLVAPPLTQQPEVNTF